MTDKEIIKALEKRVNYDCETDCSFKSKHCVKEFCKVFVDRNILDLINRQKAEIERLKWSKSTGLKEIESTVNEFWTDLQQMSMFKGKDKPTLEELLEYIEQVKVDAYKEFAERLKMREQAFPRADGLIYAVSASKIDDVAAELTGETLGEVGR